MNTTSIFQLKANPGSIIRQSVDYPIAVENRNKVEAYLIGRSLYEKMLDLIEDKLDRLAIANTDFSEGKEFELWPKAWEYELHDFSSG